MKPQGTPARYAKEASARHDKNQVTRQNEPNSHPVAPWHVEHLFSDEAGS